MKKYWNIFLVALVFASLTVLNVGTVHGTSIYSFTALTGGGTGALDRLQTPAGIGIAPVTGDSAIGCVANVWYLYSYDSTCVTATNSPSIIRPTSNVGCWSLGSAYNSSNLEGYSASHFQVAGSYLTSSSALDATKLSGNLPAISGASLTGVLTGSTLDDVADGTTYSKIVNADINASNHLDYIWTRDATPKSLNFVGLTANRTVTVPDTDFSLAAFPSSPSSGDILYYNGSWGSLAKGANNTFLSVNGAGTLGYNSTISLSDAAAQIYKSADPTSLIHIASNCPTGTQCEINSAAGNTTLVAGTMVPNSTTVNGHALSANVSVTPADIPLIPADGSCYNYQLTTAIVSNGLVITVVGANGNAISATNPMTCNIRSTVYTTTSPITLTVPAGQYMAAGTAEVLTQDTDYFVYATVHSGVVYLLISRVPYALTVADFSATANATNGFYAGTTTSTDPVRVIGRINAANSGTANYYWYLPTQITINRPIYNTRKLVYVPTLACGSGSATWTTQNGTYYIDKYSIFITNHLTVNVNSVCIAFLQVSIPISADSINTRISGGDAANVAYHGGIYSTNYYMTNVSGTFTTANGAEYYVSGSALIH